RGEGARRVAGSGRGAGGGRGGRGGEEQPEGQGLAAAGGPAGVAAGRRRARQQGRSGVVAGRVRLRRVGPPSWLTPLLYQGHYPRFASALRRAARVSGLM